MNRALEVKNMITRYTALARNYWQLPPIYRIVENTVEIEKINEKLVNGEIGLTVQPAQNISNTSAKCQVMIGPYEENDEQIESTFDLRNSYAGKFKAPMVVRRLRQKSLRIIVNDKVCCWHKEYGPADHALNDLETHNTLKNTVKIEGFGDINVQVGIRQSLDKEEIETITFHTVQVDLEIPPFKVEQAPVTAAPAAKKPAGAIGTAPKGKPVAKAALQAPKEEADPPLPNPLPPFPEGVLPLDVKDPDNIGNMVVGTYVEKRMNEMKAIVNKISQAGNKVPEPLMKKLLAVTKNCSSLKAQMESGKLTNDEYKKMINLQLAKDQKLHKYLTELKQLKKAKIVQERIDAINYELKNL